MMRSQTRRHISSEAGYQRLGELQVATMRPTTPAAIQKTIVPGGSEQTALEQGAISLI